VTHVLVSPSRDVVGQPSAVEVALRRAGPRTVLQLAPGRHVCHAASLHITRPVEIRGAADGSSELVVQGELLLDARAVHVVHVRVTAARLAVGARTRALLQEVRLLSVLRRLLTVLRRLLTVLRRLLTVLRRLLTVLRCTCAGGAWS
jgi:hypothetical protein